MAIVKYRGFRNAEEERVATNNAMMGLLVGSKLAAHALEKTTDTTTTLSGIFPTVEHVHRFDLRTDTAQDVLRNSEELLASMAMLYGFGLHEHVMREMLDLLRTAGNNAGHIPKKVDAAQLHSKFSEATGHTFEPELITIMDILRKMRNARAHNGGKVPQELETLLTTISTLSGSGATKPTSYILWEEIAKQPPPRYAKNSHLAIGLTELVLVLAVTKRLAESANTALQTSLPRQTWLAMLKEDFCEFAQDEKLVGNPDQMRRKLKGFARRFYEPLAFNNNELQDLL